jgi:cellobiose-specific phosphotransferase system component IIA
MLKSESTEKLFASLVLAQGEMQAAKMNAENPFMHNKYADIGALIEAAKPVLAKNGLAVTQLLSSENGQIGVTTMLVHTSGQFIGDASYLPIGEEKGKSLAQVAGSMVTYLRRYGYAAILSMYAEEDDDGQASQRPSPKKEVKGVEWKDRISLVAKVLKELTYFKGQDDKHVLIALEHLEKGGKLTKLLDDNAVFVIMQRAATVWEKEKKTPAA